MLCEAVALGREILSPQPIGDDQIQPASIDLRLGEVAYRVRASFLPEPAPGCATSSTSSRCIASTWRQVPFWKDCVCIMQIAHLART